MLKLLLNFIFGAITLHFTAQIVSGFEILDFMALFIAVIVISILNALIRPILALLTLPINILTLGLFSFVLNAIILNVTAGLVDGFDIKNWTAAILGAIVLAIVQAFINLLTPGKRKLIG